MAMSLRATTTSPVTRSVVADLEAMDTSFLVDGDESLGRNR